MPTVIAGTQTDLIESPENIVLHLIMDKWKLTQDGYVPAKDAISFSLYGWTGRKSYQISMESSTPPRLRQLNIGTDQWIQYNDPILIHLWMVKNTDVVPPQLHHITQRVEQIVLQNVNNVGYGISSIKLMSLFSVVNERQMWMGSFPNQVQISVYHTTATVELLYYRVSYGTLSGIRTSKTHKYNVEVIDTLLRRTRNKKSIHH